MKSRSIFAVAASLGIVLSACTSGGASPSAAAPSAPAVTAAAPSAGVNAITCTPAPRATSIACTMSPYFRVGAALMNISLTGRWS